MTRRSVRFASTVLVGVSMTAAAMTVGLPARAEEAPHARSGATPSPWNGRTKHSRSGRDSQAPRDRRHARLAFLPSGVAHRPAAIPASATVAPRQVTVEVHDIGPGKARQVEVFTLSLTERGGSKLRSRIGNVEYEIRVSMQGNTGDSPLVFDVSRSQRGPGPSVAEAAVNATVRIKKGVRVIVARVMRSDGSRTEVLASIK
jgi:hypothetical protein